MSLYVQRQLFKKTPMRTKQLSLDALRAEQVFEFEQRLEEFLEAEERRINRTSMEYLRSKRREDLTWHAKRIIFEVCVMVSIRRSKDVRDFLASENCGRPDRSALEVPKPSPRQLILRCLGGAEAAAMAASPYARASGF
jgi:hypothetical protein